MGHSVGGRNLPEVLYLCIWICASLVGDYSCQVRKLVLEAADPQRQGLPLFGVGDNQLGANWEPGATSALRCSS